MRAGSEDHCHARTRLITAQPKPSRDRKGADMVRRAANANANANGDDVRSGVVFSRRVGFSPRSGRVINGADLEALPSPERL